MLLALVFLIDDITMFVDFLCVQYVIDKHTKSNGFKRNNNCNDSM